MSQAVDIASLWERYRELENRGERGAMLRALDAFVERISTAPPDVRATWVDEFLRSASDVSGDVPVRAPLFRRVLFPELEPRYRAGDAVACRALARFAQELFRYREGWAALGSPGEIDLWKEAYRRDSTSEVARAELARSMARFIKYTLHEVPAGVLYGPNGATLEESSELLAELASFRGLLTPSESEKYRELLVRASFHYPRYRAYLQQTVTRGYANFLAEQRGETEVTDG